MSKEKKAAPEAERETKAPDPAEDGAQDAQECVSEDGAAVQTEIDDLQKQLEAAKKQSDEYLNMAQRMQADFENFRRRNNAVRADAYEDGARAFIKTILPVMDNLERALAAESADAACALPGSSAARQANASAAAIALRSLRVAPIFSCMFHHRR